MRTTYGAPAAETWNTNLERLKPGEAFWYNNIVEAIDEIEIDGVVYKIHQKSPFAALVVRGGRRRGQA